MEELTAYEIYEAERRLVYLEQKRYFEEEITALEKNQSISSSSKIILLNPFLNQGVMCLRGRLSEAEYGTVSKPAILPKESHLSKILIKLIS